MDQEQVTGVDGDVSAGDDAGYSDQENFSPEIVDEAREGGWKPKHEMRDPAKYVDPETFVKRGREILPIVNKNNERLKREMLALRAELDQSNKSVKQLQEYHEKLEERAYERAMADLKAQKKAAASEGDFETAAALDDQLDTLREQKPKPVAAQAPAPQQITDPALKAWMEENKSWYNDQNPEMLDYANAVSLRIRRQDPSNSIVGQDFLDEVMKAMKKQFPDKFGARRREPSVVEGGNPGGASTRNGEVKIADLPPEARAAYRDLKGEVWYQELAKSLKITTEQLYIRDYGV